MTSSDRFPVSVRSAVKSNFTVMCAFDMHLSNKMQLVTLRHVYLQNSGRIMTTVYSDVPSPYVQ